MNAFLQLGFKVNRSILVCFFSLLLFQAFATNDAFEQRKSSFIDANLALNGNDLVFQAFRGIPLDQNGLNNILAQVVTSPEADFRLTGLVRILNFTDGEYEDQILPVIQDISYWLPDSDNLRQYWSENHMLMWMSAEWLLYEKYGWEPRPTLRQNLIHYLEIKNEYGYYEFLSPTYLPFTSAGLLNLIDFAEDLQIKELATKALARLYNDVLLFVNDKGVYYPTAGRTKYDKYINPYYQDIPKIAYLLSGIGPVPIGAGIGSSALATSSFNPDGLVNSWVSKLSMTFKSGHPLSKSPQIHGQLSRQDRIIFDWSSGAYFHPFVAENTVWQLNNYNMWGHEEFASFAQYSFIPPSFAPAAATVAASFTRSSYIGNVEIELFKNKGIVLSSAQDYWKGRLGYQQWPWVATIENTAVYTRSGEVENWEDLPERQSNTNLPYIDQDENVALIMYRHNWDLPIWGHDNFDVYLHWRTDDFDEVRELDNWMIGRVDNSYIAVRRHCIATLNDHIACDVSDAQTWAVVVGNLDTHNSFDQFISVIDAAQFEERWYFDWQHFSWVYYGHIQVDGQDIDYAWKGNILSGPSNNRATENTNGRQYVAETNHILVYPNPTNDQFIIDGTNFDKEIIGFAIYDMTGHEVYRQKTDADNNYIKQIATASWKQGMYSIIIESKEGYDVKRLMVNH